MANDETWECYINADNHDVTNIQEAILFAVLLISALLIMFQVHINIRKINRMMHGEENESLQILWRMNGLIGLTVIFETLQKSEQLLAYLLQKIAGDPFPDSTIITITQIYHVLTMIKIFLFYLTVLITSKLWFDLAKLTKQGRYHVCLQSIYAYIYPALPYMLAAIYLFNILFYLACMFKDIRLWLIVLSTSLISITFLYSVTIFKMYVWPLQIMPQRFKFRLNIMMILMQISCVFRIIWFTLQNVIPNQLDKMKAYNYDTNTDESWGWFIQIIIYQPFVNFFPIYFLTLIFSPRAQFKSVTKTQSKYYSMTSMMIIES